MTIFNVCTTCPYCRHRLTIGSLTEVQLKIGKFKTAYEFKEIICPNLNCRRLFLINEKALENIPVTESIG